VRGPESDPRVPDLAEIAITPEGGIELAGAGPVEGAPVLRAGRILLTLLEEAQTLPVQLRLLALQEVSPAPSCHSLLEFSTHLELFERPGRRKFVRAVYDRFQQLPVLEVEASPAGPPSATSPPPDPAVPVWWRRRKVQAVAAAGLVAVLILATIELWPRPQARAGEDRRGPVTKAVSATVDKVSQATDSGLTTVARWFGLAATDRPTAPAPVETTVTADSVESPTPRSRPRPVRPVELPHPVEATPESPPPTTDTTVYSPDDAGVVPPEFVRSRLPSNPPPGVRSEDLPEMEVVVSATGEVESVKLLTQRAGVLPAMMLSAVKNWSFQPATKAGTPVRYRMRVRLTNQ
jgi:hypothetical protein